MKKNKRLHLNRETLRKLHSEDLAQAGGAEAAPTAFSVNRPCTYFMSECLCVTWRKCPPSMQETCTMK